MVWFSCGAASAVASKMAVAKYSNVRIVYCNTLAGEHEDNPRFLRDVEKWIGHPIEIISSKVYEDVDDVFMSRRYMSGIHGAPCTTVMKKIPRLEYQLPNDLHIFGLTGDEAKRRLEFEGNNPDIDMDWILGDMHKRECFEVLRAVGIQLPEMYRLGFKNNNCIGCVKASSIVYWKRTRELFPIIFEKRVQQSREIGCRLTRLRGKRIFLDEIPEDVPDLDLKLDPEEDIDCGVICVKGSPNDRP